jgi:D-alanyl-D-alanine carboxypeptidase
MTSGIASYTEDKQWQNEFFSDHARVWKPEELVPFGIKDSPLFDPGTQRNYSNSKLVLLGLVLEQVSGEPIDQLYRERIIEPLGLKGTSFPGANPSIPDPHAQGYTLQGQSSGAEPVDATNWNPSWAWTAGGMISTVEDLLVYGRALGTGEGLLPSKQQAERLDSFVSDVPPLDQPPLKGNLAYGIGLANEHGWIGHNGELPGYNTYLFYHPDLDAVVAVEVNSDTPSGDYPSSRPTMKEKPGTSLATSPRNRSSAHWPRRWVSPRRGRPNRRSQPSSGACRRAARVHSIGLFTLLPRRVVPGNWLPLLRAFIEQPRRR